VDLVSQARADIGDVFCGNLFFGLILLSSIMVVHLLLFHIPSTRLIRLLKRKAPFPKLELYMLIIGFQGVTTSSAQMLSTEGWKCKLAGGTVLSVPTLFWIWTGWHLWRHLHPKSGARKATYDEVEEEWVELEPSKQQDPDAYFASQRIQRQSSRHALARQSSRLQRTRSQVALGVSLHFERTKMNMDADWTHKYSPLFEDFRDTNGGWATIVALMFKQYVFALFLAFMVQAFSCEVESILIIALLSAWMIFSLAVRPYADPLQRMLELFNTVLEVVLVLILIIGALYAKIDGIVVIAIAALIVLINILLRLQSMIMDRLLVLWDAIYPKASKIPLIGAVFRYIERQRKKVADSSAFKVMTRRTTVTKLLERRKSRKIMANLAERDAEGQMADMEGHTSTAIQHRWQHSAVVALHQEQACPDDEDDIDQISAGRQAVSSLSDHPPPAPSPAWLETERPEQLPRPHSHSPLQDAAEAGPECRKNSETMVPEEL
jgi:hypothetical protein